jgi:hypothetical protein
MPIFLTEDETQCVKSGFEQALSRLQRSLESARQKELWAEKHFQYWQEKWSVKRCQITERLAAIDSELARLSAEPIEGPTFSVVGESH